MVKLWAYRIEKGLNTIDDVPERYQEQVRQELEL
jgi:hypothetical protein